MESAWRRGAWGYDRLWAGWRCVGGHELSWCKDYSNALDEPGHSSITGLPVSDRAGPPPVLSMQSFDVVSRGGKCLTAGIHGVCLFLVQAGDASAGTHFPGVESPSDALDETRQPSITGLPASDRVAPLPFCLCSRFLLSRGSKKCLTAGIHGVCLSSGQAGDAVAGSNFPGVKILPPRWMRPGHSSITSLPASDRAGSPSVAYLFVPFCFAERRSTAVGRLCFPELPPRRRGFYRHRQTR